MIAVPFQAYAAAAMGLCAPGHADGIAASFAAPAEVVHDHAMHDSGHDSPHDGAPADAGHQCGTCGACHATALTGLPTLLMAHALPPADLVEPSVAVATLASRVPDKPPRS